MFITLILTLGGYSLVKKNNQKNTKTNQVITYPGDYWVGAVEYSDNIVCELKISAVVNFEDEKLKGQTNIDKNTTRLTFVDINSENPYLIGNLGDKAPLTKIDNGNVVYFFETTSFGNINIFTLFKDKNIMIMSKQYELIGMPFGMVMIGDCMSGLN